MPLYYTRNSVYLEESSFVISHENGLTCCFPFCIFSLVAHISVGKTLTKYLENLNNSKAKTVFFLRRLSFVFETWICLDLTKKPTLDCIYLRLSKITLDRRAYLPTGGRNVVNCSRPAKPLGYLDSEWQTECYWLALKGTLLKLFEANIHYQKLGLNLFIWINLHWQI